MTEYEDKHKYSVPNTSLRKARKTLMDQNVLLQICDSSFQKKQVFSSKQRAEFFKHHENDKKTINIEILERNNCSPELNLKRKKSDKDKFKFTRKKNFESSSQIVI